MVIREMASADQGAIAALYDDLDAVHRAELPGLFRRTDGAARGAAFFREIEGDADAAMFVADEGEVVGFVYVVVRDAPDLPIFVAQRRGLVNDLFVREDRRRGGLGRALVMEAEGWARRRGADGVEAVVYEFNHGAKALFASMGYGALSRRLSKGD